jgi:regulator of protease activity HflC (stomatin/prohibitin superfamily)
MSDSIKPNLPISPREVVGGLFRILGRLLRFKLVWITGVVIVVLVIAARSCTTYVAPDMVAIKQVYYGGGAGIKKELYGPGLHFVAGGVERLHMFPRDLQVVNFSESPSEVSREQRSAPAIKIQTSDGYNVILDVTVVYRILDAYKVFTDAGPGRAFEDKLVIPRADRILRKTLGELNAEEFYKGPKRIEKARGAKEALVVELKDYGVELDEVLIRGYIYDPKYQQLIEGRKISDQTVFLRGAESAEAIEKRKRDTAIAEGKARMEVELSRGAAEVQKLHAQADLYTRQQAAAGKLKVELAEATGTRLENDALQGVGSENYVGLRMAETLKGVKVLVLPSDGANGFNPLDLPALMKKLEVP